MGPFPLPRFAAERDTFVEEVKPTTVSVAGDRVKDT
jgi:hypothetical protein